MPRALWSGAISFGLVNVPVRMYSGDRRERPALPPDPRVRRVAHPLPEDLREERQARAGRRDREGLRARQRRLRLPDRRRLRGRRERRLQADRDPRLRALRPDRPDHVRADLLPGAGRGRGEGVRADGQGHADSPSSPPSPPTSSTSTSASAACASATICSCSSACTSPTRSGRPRASRPSAARKIEKSELDLAADLIDRLTGDFDHSKYHDTVPRAAQEGDRRQAQGQGAACAGRAPSRRRPST